MYHVLPGTLEEIKANTLFRKFDWSHVPVATAGKKIAAYVGVHGDNTYPEQEAIRFYLMNHVCGLLSAEYKAQEPLPEAEYAMLTKHVAVSSDIAARLMYYVILITTRESRHVHNAGGMYNALGDEGVLTPESVKAFREFHTNYVNDSYGVVNAFKTNSPKMSLGAYMNAIEWQFYNGHYSDGYGGAPWGNIAKAARMVIFGEMSFEMFADMAFALCHNGGSMFNKGMLYNDVNKPLMLKILDVQRAGMIPQLLNYDAPGCVDDDQLIYDALAFGKAHFGAAFEGSVDWDKVMALGAVGDYSDNKKVKIHPSVAMADEAKKFYVMPGVYAVKTERAAA